MLKSLGTALYDYLLTCVVSIYPLFYIPFQKKVMSPAISKTVVRVIKIDGEFPLESF